MTGERVMWDAEMDAALLAARLRGHTWERIAKHLGVHVHTAMRRAHRLGIPTSRLNRGPITGERMTVGNPPEALLRVRLPA